MFYAQKLLTLLSLTSEEGVWALIPSILFALLLLLGTINYKRYREKRRHVFELAEKNKKINRQYKLLQQTNEQNELLLREIHHRVKNNLQLAASLLRIQMRTSENPEAIAALNESSSRLHSMLLIHQELYRENQIGLVNLKHYTQQLTEHLIQSYQPLAYQAKVLIEIADSLNLKAEVVTPLGLIMTELITNSLKYAKPARRLLHLTIQLQQNEMQQYKLVYLDNGGGPTQNIDILNSKTMGMRLLRDLSKQLQGTMQYELNGSSYFTLTFAST